MAMCFALNQTLIPNLILTTKPNDKPDLVVNLDILKPPYQNNITPTKPHVRLHPTQLQLRQEPGMAKYHIVKIRTLAIIRLEQAKQRHIILSIHK